MCSARIWTIRREWRSAPRCGTARCCSSAAPRSAPRCAARCAMADAPRTWWSPTCRCGRHVRWRSRPLFGIIISFPRPHATAARVSIRRTIVARRASTCNWTEGGHFCHRRRGRCSGSQHFCPGAKIWPIWDKERIIAPERAYRASERGSSKFYDERRKQLPAWKPAGSKVLRHGDLSRVGANLMRGAGMPRPPHSMFSVSSQFSQVFLMGSSPSHITSVSLSMKGAGGR